MNNSLKIRINLNKKKKGLKKIPLFLLFLLLFLDVGLMSFAATDSSDSNNTDEWRMDGRTLNGTRYYPGLILPNISQLEVRTYTTTGSTGDPTIADGFMYGIALRGSLYKLNASNISQRVNQSSNALFQYPVQALWNGFVYAADEYGNVYQYNSSNLGQTLATNTQPYPQHYSSPIVYQGYVYFTDWWTSGGPIYQANASNITQVITTSPRQGCDSAPVIANSFIYYGCGSTIYQLNATNISQQKAQYTAGGSMATGSTLTVTDNFLYFGTNDNKLYQLNASNVSQHIANFTTNGDISGGPAYAHGFVYIGSADGYTYQLNATNISQHIANFSTGAVYGSPIVTNNYLIVGGTSLYQLNAMNISQMITNYSLSLSDTSPTIVRGMLYVSAGYSFYQFGSEIPTVTLNSPTNISYFSQSIDSITFNCSAEDNLALTNISLYLTNFQNASFSFNQTTIVTGLTNITSWNLSLTRGNYTWNCLVYDADGNSKWGVNRTIYPDLSAPAIRVIYPTNNTNTSNTGLNINYTATDSYLSTCWYSNDSMSTNITLDNCANITTVIWGEGAHNLIIWANDSSNNINNSFVKFTIDTILPQINIVYPANNTNSSNNRLNINYTRSDANLASCWYSNDTMTKNTTLSTCANITAVIWTEGQHNLTVWANDSAGNKNNSLVSFYIDSLAPEINITYPSNNTNSINNGLNVNYTVSDLNLASCWYTNDSKTTNITIAGCSNLTSIIWGEGQHNVTIWANDTFGNKNNSFVVFTMDTLGPAFTAIANQSIDYDSALSYTIIASDSSGISCYRMNDTTNFNLNCNGDLKNNTLIPEGLYWLNITANDTLKNENYGLMYVNVSLNPQIKISVITPSGNINASQNQTFQVSVNVSCKYADCGGINVSLDPETNEINLQFENEGKKDEEGITTQTAISLYDNKTFEYDIQDGCSISDGMTDVFDGGLVLYINATSYTGLRSTTEDNGREAICNGQTLSGLNVSRKVYVPITGNFSRFLEVLHNPGTSTACAFIRLYQDMGSDGSDFMNTSDGNLTWELSDHWMIWDDTSVTAGDDVAGFIYQQDEAAEKVDKVTPTSASGGINSQRHK